MTLDLFDFTPDRREDSPKRPLRTWSYTRRTRVEGCLSAYYYDYYGAAVHSAKTEPHKQELRALRKLSNRHLRTGEHLHLVIRTALKALCKGEVWEVDRMQRWARQLFEQDLAFSRKYLHGEEIPAEDRGPRLLLEYYYGFSDADALCETAMSRLMTALANFAEHEAFEQFRNGALQPEALIEHPLHFDLAGVHIQGKVDLAYPEYVLGERRIQIVDWKLGGAPSRGTSLQLFSYAPWAVEHYGCALEQIDLHLAHLEDGTVTSYRITDAEAREAQCQILQDMEKMRMLHPYGQAATATAFAPRAKPKVCKNCFYQGPCPDAAVQSQSE